MAVIAWGETLRQQALKAAFALAPLSSKETELWIFGEDIQVESLRDLPYQKILILEGFGNLYTGADQYAEEFSNLMKKQNVGLAVFPDKEKGGELAVRVSLRMGTSAVLKVTGMRQTEGNIFLEKKVYSCNLDGSFLAPEGPFTVTIDKNAMEESGTRGKPDILRLQVLAASRDAFGGCKEKKLPECDSLEYAKRLVVAGRGAANGDTLEALRQIGSVLKAGLGATRPAVLEAMLPYSSMIGMTGVITRPELCMVFGASGSAPFMIGVRDSHILVAVNRDPDAAIFRSCDLAVVDDAEKFAAAFLDVVREGEGRL